jgi:hypothetical protein
VVVLSEEVYSMIFYVQSIGRAFWISPELERKLKANVHVAVREWKRRRALAEALRKAGFSKKRIDVFMKKRR